MHEVALDLLILLGLRDRTGCTVVAVERDGELIMDFSPRWIPFPSVVRPAHSPVSTKRLPKQAPDPFVILK